MSTSYTPRLRVLAGPNGSGKSTLKAIIKPHWLGVYINPDEIEKSIKQHGFIDLSTFKLHNPAAKLIPFLHQSKLLSQQGLTDEIHQLTLADSHLYFNQVSVNAYWASVLADFIRQELVLLKASFTFETVMSSLDKIDFLKKAKTLGFRIYLYYIATEDPLININRVKVRVAQGGHDVPHEKIITRYQRSLNLLIDAIRYSHRAFLFDNSNEGAKRAYIAEIIDAQRVEMKVDARHLPHWINRYFWQKIRTTPQP